MSNLKSEILLNRRIFFFLFILVFFVYFNSLWGSFLSDDIPAILQNPEIKNYSQMFVDPATIFHRFIVISIANIFNIEPFGFHLVNILFHCGVTIILFLLISRFFNNKVAIIASSLFAVHPINSEAVAWISAGTHSQYSFFLLLSFLFYQKYLDNYLRKNYFISLTSFGLSLLTSEKSIVFPLILVVYALSQKDFLKKWKHIIPYFALSLCLAFGYFYYGAISQRINTTQMSVNQGRELLNPFVQIPIAITSYLELIFWPKGLTLYHSEMNFTKIEYLFRLGVFISFLALIVWFLKKDRRIFFWLSFFIISLLPTLTPLGISWIVAERYVYLGTIGIIVPVAVFIEYFGRKFSEPKLPYVILGVLVILLGTRTILRNSDWQNQDTLWLAAAKTSPSSHQNHNNLGDYYGRHGNYEKAIEEFQTAIKLKPNYAEAYHNLGNIYKQVQDYDQAVASYRKALEYNPKLWQSLVSIGGIYYKTRDTKRALIEFQKALAIDPQNAEIQKLLQQINP